MDRPVLIEMQGAGREQPARPRGAPSRTTALAGVVGMLAAAMVVVSVAGDDRERAAPADSVPADTAPGYTRLPELGSTQPSPDPVHAARCYVARPDAAHLRAVFTAVGGFDGLQLGTASGAFEIVTFDALDPDRLIAARRGGYGPAEHQDVTERWRVHSGRVVQTRWNASAPHDFVHHNTDGTTTMWVAEEAHAGVAQRRAVVLDRAGAVATVTSAPLFADRFAVDGGTVFALVGGPDAYSPRETGYGALLADDGEQRVVLAPGGGFGWIDVPVPGLLVAYPAAGAAPVGTTAVWDTSTLTPLPDHPLAGRDHQRVAVSGDRRVAVGVTSGGELEAIDLRSGQAAHRFGGVDVREVDRPIVLSADGRVAITVERSGDVTIWFVGDDEPIATHAAGAGVPRWLPTSRSAARLATALAPDATRVALRIDARPPIGVTWRLIDTDVDAWLDRVLAPADPAPGAGTPPIC